MTPVWPYSEARTRPYPGPGAPGGGPEMTPVLGIHIKV